MVEDVEDKDSELGLGLDYLNLGSKKHPGNVKPDF